MSHFNYQPRCYSCGKFCKPFAWKIIYSGAPIPTPDEEIYHCEKCGPFTPQNGIKPEYSCGVFK